MTNTVRALGYSLLIRTEIILTIILRFGISHSRNGIKLSKEKLFKKKAMELV